MDADFLVGLVFSVPFLFRVFSAFTGEKHKGGILPEELVLDVG